MTIDARLRNLNRIRRLSRLMDTALRIPGTRFRFGLDPIIGLVPGLGDLVTTAISGYILFLAARFRLPGSVFKQMVFNIALETIVGAIPFLGDIFDAFYKSNVRNLALLETYLEVEEPQLSEADPLNLSSAAQYQS
ncbi:MAG: DUF4112 domain-containing protein [Leptolyngbya sp. SIO4C1]|nr:DUF4112 domain-containing protein [Leptolyngbya sp. SIO4C1]